MNLTTKFTLIFSGILLFMGLVSFYGIYRFQYDILEQDITEKLENAAQLNLDRLDRMFYERLTDLDIISADPVFQSRSASREDIRSELDGFLAKYPQYASVTYFNMDRTIIASAGPPAPGKYRRHPLTEYWPEIYAGKNHVVNISKSASLNLPTLHFANRVMDRNGRPLGVLVARIPATELYGLMDDKRDAFSKEPRYDVDVLDQDGTVLYSNHNKTLVLNAIDEDFALIKEALPAVRTVGTLTEIHQKAHSNEQRVLLVFAKEQGYRAFQSNGWIMKVMHPADKAFAPVSALSRQVFIFLLGISMIGIAAILAILLFTVIRPIKRLNRATTLLGQGQLNARVSIESSDEIGKLTQSFNAMASNLKEAREQLAFAADAALARARLAERKIIEISEETLQQIGRELHDDLGQQLTGVAFMTEVLRQHLKDHAHPEEKTAAKITALINEAISKTHNLAHDLHPVEMKESGLCPMLTRLASKTEAIYGIKCEFHCDGEPNIKTPLAITNLFRIVQEAVHNAVKHGAATRITIDMTVTPESVTIEVADNGRGIGSQAELDAKGGLGMHTMYYRASLLNATLNVSEPPGGGTQITVCMPAAARSS